MKLAIQPLHGFIIAIDDVLGLRDNIADVWKMCACVGVYVCACVLCTCVCAYVLYQHNNGSMSFQTHALHCMLITLVSFLFAFQSYIPSAFS